jgi:Big-like domain-containing protein
MNARPVLLTGIAAVVALGAAGTAAAVNVPPNLHPVVQMSGDNPTYYVDISQPGKVLVRFPTRINNLAGSNGVFEVDAANNMGNSQADATQLIYTDTGAIGGSQPLTGKFVNDTGSGTWDLQDVVKYTLTPTGGGTPIDSQLTAVCLFDDDPGGIFSANPCKDAGLSSVGSRIGITNGFFDVYTTATPDTRNFFDVSGVPAGTQFTLTARVNPSVPTSTGGGTVVPGRIVESDYSDNQDVGNGSVTIPGIVAANVSGGSTVGTTLLKIQLMPSVTVVAPTVLVGTPTTTPAADNGNKTFAITVQGTKGVATVVPGTGEVTYAPLAGQTGADSFTYKVTDSRGLSATGVVSVNVAPPVAPVVPTTPVTPATPVTPVTPPPLTPIPPNTKAKAKVGPKLGVRAKFVRGRLVISFTPRATGTARILARSGKRTVARCSVKVKRNHRATCRLRIPNRLEGRRIQISSTLVPKAGRAAKATTRSIRVPARIR